MSKDRWDSLAEIAGAMTANMRRYGTTGTKRWDASIAMIDLAYQAGHLLKLKMQLDNERDKEGRSAEEIRACVEVELAEIVALATFIAAELKLDIGQGFQSMLESDAQKIRERTNPGK